MSNYALLILLAVAICAAVVIFEYVHNKHRRFHIEHLGAAVQEILSGKQDGQMLRKDFLKALRVHFHCSPKESLFLSGLARKKGRNHPKYADLLIAKKTRKCLLASFFVIIRK